MSITIPADDYGQIRVFSMPAPLPPDLAQKDTAALRALFGVEGLNPDFVDVIDPRDLAPMGLADYLRQGYDVEPDAADTAALQGLSDRIVVLLMSRATTGDEVTLSLASDVRHETTLSTAAALAVPQAMRSDAARGVVGDPPQKAPSDGAISGRVAMIALLVLFAVVGLMIWVAA